MADGGPGCRSHAVQLVSSRAQLGSYRAQRDSVRERSETIRPRKAAPSITRSLSTPFMDCTSPTEPGAAPGTALRTAARALPIMNAMSTITAMNATRTPVHTLTHLEIEIDAVGDVEEVKMSAIEDDEQKISDETLSDELVRNLYDF